MNINEIKQTDKDYFMNTFGERAPVAFTHGEGMNLWDTEGKKYTDFFAGIAVSSLGHSHPALVDAICTQAHKFIHCSNLYYIEKQAELAKLLCENMPCDKVFFSNSGAEANEGAIKLARIYFKKRGQSEKYEIISLVNSFHGRTLTTLSATGQDKYRLPFTPLTPGFKNVTMNDKEALLTAVTSNTCAIMLEAVQGESGVYPLSQDYMDFVSSLCKEKELLLIFDEVQAGMGRTGKMLGFMHYNVKADIFTLAKALGGGFPMGALCATNEVASAFSPGDHGSTFGGNPLACACGVAAVSTLVKENLIDNAKNMGEYFYSQIKKLMENCNLVSGYRGKGLMIAVVLSKPLAKTVKEKLLEKGYLVGNVGDDVLRILPPLIVKKEDIDGFISTLGQICDSLYSC